MHALELEIIGAGKSFGSFRALDRVSLKIRAGTIHALLGENGAGKSTLVKGLVGYSPLDQGAIVADQREVEIRGPRVPNQLGIGMVYQHFTLAPSLSVAENLLLARGDLPLRIRWSGERAALRAFMQTMPFALDLERPVSSLSAGEKQKLEILKQLYLQRRLLILDEPTSVLTPQEADEVLGLMHTLTRRQALTVLMITHKFHEVTAYADDVTVLRRGQLVGSARVADTGPAELAHWMMGHAREEKALAARPPVPVTAVPGLEVASLTVNNDRGVAAVRALSLQVRRGEIVGLAGISGNGQKELVEALLGQRRRLSGEVRIDGAAYGATRSEMRARRVFALPEEPLRNACIAGMSVAENMALRNFDVAPFRRRGWLAWSLDRSALRRQAHSLISAFNVRPPVPERAIGTLSGGNVQRAVLARELGDASNDQQAANVLIVANPVFGLDFASVADIHARLLQAREQGAAILLVSEDLDELLALSDRILVMTDGAIVHAAEQVATHGADRAELGRHMAGHTSTQRESA
ncbi:ABC transporter ATP-binding protein [Herbaspirillum sp. alder98]|uniref:ABC transporter ATP-binding protein n=1 Tax=Herbaspirillum sp. alder98 TaxID=2913096 RepID=UPI001CD87892|nr:ABC transporter ATP-binding protein [Herbaspirillum sp. alder98]MCA1323296.1 ABC transporter ATP-binding protein [Herbaspirillum sp. alder98]